MVRFALLLVLCSCSLRSARPPGDCAEAHDVFAATAQPLLQAQCITCHVAGGIAASSGFLLEKDATEKNYAAFLNVAEQQQNGVSLFLLKPTGAVAHTGGKIAPPGSDTYRMLDQMVGLAAGCTADAAATAAQASEPVPAPVVPSFLTSDVRRLTTAELDTTVADLLGTTTLPSATLSGDSRQSGFSANMDQRVDATTSDQILTLARALAEETVAQRLDRVLPCAPSSADCERTFVRSFASKAFRRPATNEEVTGLLAVFHAASDGGAFTEGVTAVIATVLQSASFLYVSQVGATAEPGFKQLDAFETAATLSYLSTGRAPDASLLTAAEKNELATGAQREAHMRRLLATDAGNGQLVRFVREWLGLDGLSHVDRTGGTVDFASLRPAMEQETASFVTNAAREGLAVSALVGADGVLMQAAFLSLNSGTDRSSPVKRGARVLSKLLCTDLPLPQGDVGMKAMAPLPVAAGATTRERFAQHASDTACSGCHTIIDSVGFAFEEYDQLGALRALDAGKPVDSTGELTGTDVDGPYTNASEMLARLAQSERAHACVTSFVARFATASTQASVTKSFTDTLTESEAASIVETLVAYARSDMFIRRRSAP